MIDDDHYPLLATNKPYLIAMIAIQVILILIVVLLNLTHWNIYICININYYKQNNKISLLNNLP